MAGRPLFLGTGDSWDAGHVHVLITRAIDVSTAKDVQYIKGGYSRALGWEASWCAGYHDHRVRDGRDYESQRLYIANHPARKRYEDYPHVCAEMDAAPGRLCELRPGGEGIPQGLKPLEG